MLIALWLIVSSDSTFTIPYAFAVDRSSPISMSPANSVKTPRTAARPMCLTAKPTLECAGSTAQVPAGIVVEEETVLMVCCAVFDH